MGLLSGIAWLGKLADMEGLGMSNKEMGMEFKDIQIHVTSNGFLVTPYIPPSQMGECRSISQFATFETLPSMLEWLHDHFKVDNQ